MRMVRLPAITVAILFLACATWAQHTVSDTNDKETISLLIQQVKDLQERVKALEAERVASTPARPADSQVVQASPPAPAAPPPETTTPVHDLHGLQWQGFGEADYKVLDQRQPELGTYGFVPGSAGNFYTGDFDLFLHSRLNDRSSVVADLAFEETDAQGYKVDMRQALFKYDVNDHLKLSFGRYQIGLGYYNWAFRSAAWLQTTADRPLVMEYASNGGILPTQAVGVSITGTIPSGKLGLNYIAEYGSADTIRPDITGDGLLNDENNGNHVNLGLFLKPDRVPGLRIGGSFYHDKISDLVTAAGSGSQTLPPGVNLPGEQQSPSARWDQTIVNGHVVYVTRRIEFLNEGFLIRHALIGGSGDFDTPAFYSQFSRKFGPIRPFVRYQYVNSSPRDLIYDDVGLRWGPSFGARYDVNDYIAFKAQLDHTARRGLPDLNGLHLQFAFTF